MSTGQVYVLEEDGSKTLLGEATLHIEQIAGKVLLVGDAALAASRMAEAIKLRVQEVQFHVGRLEAMEFPDQAVMPSVARQAPYWARGYHKRKKGRS